MFAGRDISIIYAFLSELSLPRSAADLGPPRGWLRLIFKGSRIQLKHPCSSRSRLGDEHSLYIPPSALPKLQGVVLIQAPACSSLQVRFFPSLSASLPLALAIQSKGIHLVTARLLNHALFPHYPRAAWYCGEKSLKLSLGNRNMWTSNIGVPERRCCRTAA